MSDEVAGRLRALAEEYVTLVEAMRGGQYVDSDEWQRLSADRTLTVQGRLALFPAAARVVAGTAPGSGSRTSTRIRPPRSIGAPS